MNKDTPSTTAIIVALGTYCTTAHWPTHDVRIARYVREMLRHAPQPYALLARMCRIPIVRHTIERIMNTMIPGMFSHYVARKHYIETSVRHAIANGCAQMVMIGGGLDTLCLRIREDVPSVTCIEIDHPATQALKRKALHALTNIAPVPEFHSTDLTHQSVSDALAHTSYTPKVTTFVIEGVLMYLTETQVRATLENIRSCAPAQSTLIVTFMEKSQAGTIGFAQSRNDIVRMWLKKNNEPFVWGIPPDNAARFFASCGWKLHAQSTWEQLRATCPHTHPPARGEHIAVLHAL
ncbi:MAG: SAM-dependent methyltransferase [Paenibacillaceae bacterium]|nr:SAM-dependent methyltransferase [Paenibacillaceae bacterium]